MGLHCHRKAYPCINLAPLNPALFAMPHSANLSKLFRKNFGLMTEQSSPASLASTPRDSGKAAEPTSALSATGSTQSMAMPQHWLAATPRSPRENGTQSLTEEAAPESARLNIKGKHIAAVGGIATTGTMAGVMEGGVVLLVALL